MQEPRQQERSREGVVEVGTRGVLGDHAGPERPRELVVELAAQAAESRPVRRKMPDTRTSITHKFSIEGHDGYITVGLYDDGSPGEIFLSMAKQGSTVSGLTEAFGRAISYALQYGVPIEDLVRNFSHMRFEPMGRTENRDIPVAQSIIDYVFRWLASR